MKFQEECGNNLAYTYLFATGKHKTEQLEQKIAELLLTTVKMSRSQYLRFLACLIT